MKNTIIVLAAILFTVSPAVAQWEKLACPSFDPYFDCSIYRIDRGNHYLHVVVAQGGYTAVTSSVAAKLGNKWQAVNPPLPLALSPIYIYNQVVDGGTFYFIYDPGAITSWPLQFVFVGANQERKPLFPCRRRAGRMNCCYQSNRDKAWE